MSSLSARRSLASSLAFTFALLVAPLLAGNAVADGSGSAPIQLGNANCGGDLPNLPVIGTVHFERIGDTLYVEVELAGAPKGATWDVEIWDGAECNQIGFIGTVSTKGKAKNYVSGSVNVAGYDSFFAALYGTSRKASGYSDSTIVSIP